MSNKNSNIVLLEVYYERIVETKEITLNDDNYSQYGFQREQDEEGNVSYFTYDTDGETKIYSTIAEVNITKKFSHQLPTPSSFSVTYADVDKEGSGRDESSGEVIRDRLGHYQSIDVTWDIVKGSTSGRNFMKVLKNLPPFFTLKYYEIENIYNEGVQEYSEIECYHGDIQYGMYLFLKDNQIWQGIKTTFIQSDVTPYNDQAEPILNGVVTYYGFPNGIDMGFLDNIVDDNESTFCVFDNENQYSQAYIQVDFEQVYTMYSIKILTGTTDTSDGNPTTFSADVMISINGETFSKVGTCQYGVRTNNIIISNSIQARYIRLTNISTTQGGNDAIRLITFNSF